ncbi:hypothetical protein [Bacillus solimangrovi]|uniref:Uncharacterized protein n=1 Tax=Bacillus solimangrovi TaxID=1305675 RepID=A0A1E5LIF6_9BACI|nr:hypothetical protein [Bacillus solimangrovi]OEH93838.1 hypothetical protein BFG57_10990 [Bacillus solimangrovi]
MKNNSRMMNFITVLTVILIVFVNGKVASATSIELTHEQKEAYYKQYENIIEKVKEEYPEAILKVVSFNDFAEEDWIEPEKFEQFAIDRAKLTFDKEQEPTPFFGGSTSKMKSKSSNVNSVSSTVNIAGSFNTQLDKVNDRQSFAGINDISSKATSGIWTQTGYSASLNDSARTYVIDVAGIYTSNGIVSSHNLLVY